MKAIIEAKNIGTPILRILLLRYVFFVFLYFIIKSNGLVSQFLRKHLYFLLL